MFAQSFGIISQDQNYEIYALEHFMTPGTHHKIIYQAGSSYLHYDMNVCTLHQIFASTWTYFKYLPFKWG